MSKDELSQTLSKMESPVVIPEEDMPAKTDSSPSIDQAKLINAWHGQAALMRTIIDNLGVTKKVHVAIIAVVVASTFVKFERSQKVVNDVANLNATAAKVGKDVASFTGEVGTRMDVTERRLALVVDAIVKGNEARMADAKSKDKPSDLEAEPVADKLRVEAMVTALKAQAELSPAPKRAAVAKKLKAVEVEALAEGIEVEEF